jgi:catechol 2,3-dioxygenase-like lactoylglutathione lyase family enzyme
MIHAGRQRHATILLIIVSVCAAIPGTHAQTRRSAVTGACHVSPVVSDLDRSARFYHNVIGLDLVPPSVSRSFPWDTDPGHLALHGLPQSRLRFVGARLPNTFCGVELVEFGNAGQRPVRRRLQDPGAAMLILIVQDIDAMFSRIEKAGATVLTKGGRPIAVGPAKTARAVIVADPDGHFIEIAQLAPTPQKDRTPTSNVMSLRLRVTVSDAEKTARYYREALGIDLKLDAGFTKDASVMAMMGFPEGGEYRIAVGTLPGSPLVLEFIEFKGVGKTKTVVSRVQDPGSYRLQLNVSDIDATLADLKKAGSRVISSNGVPVRMTFGLDPWRLAVVQDPNNLFLVIQQRIAH